MSRELYPPLDWIARELFEEKDPAETGASPDEHQPLGEGELDLDMPGFLQDMVRRRVEAQQAYPPGPPAVGQIRGLACVPQAGEGGRAVGRSYGVLLGACLGGQRWSGWLVTQEADYATDRDLLLEESDGPCAPEAAMVQTWNPACCLIRGDEPILGRLAPARLAAVLLLADGAGGRSGFVAPRPGRIGAWDLDAQTTVVTGTPLGDGDDSRHRYQQLYRDLATEIGAAAERQPQTPATSGERGWWVRLQHIFVRPAWTFGALAALLAQSLWLLSAGLPSGEETGVYRGAAQVRRPDGCAPGIRAVFKPDSSYAEVVLLVRRIDGTLVDGPSETGEVWITLPSGQKAQEASQVLRLSDRVEAADVVMPDPKVCRK